MSSSCRRRLQSAIRNFPLFVLLVSAIPLYGQPRNYVLSGNIDLAAGGNNAPSGFQFGQAGVPQPLAFFYGAYPSLTLTSTGPDSTVTASYAFGLDQTRGLRQIRSNSHTASVQYSRPISSKWTIALTESLQLTADPSTFNALRGVTVPPEQSRFVFNPVAARVSTRTNNVSFVTGYRINDRSSIGVNASHSLRDYSSDTRFSGVLSDQQVISTGVGYTRQTAARESWTMAYTGSYTLFGDFDNSRTHGATLGYSNGIRPDLTFRLNVGASHVKGLEAGDGYVGYNASTSLEKTLRQNSFSIFYSQAAGQASGLGSVSNTRTAGLAWRYTTADFSVFVDTSVFDTKGSLGNPLESRGNTAALSFGIPITTKLSLQAGGYRQQQSGNSLFAFTQKRFFISIRYVEPNLWSATR